jgi:hypothetical protein
MRAYKSAHVEANSSAEFANLQAVNPIFRERIHLCTHESMVWFPSLPKIRLSELAVSFNPTTSGSLLVPAIYSVALHSGQCEISEYQNQARMLLSKVTNVESKRNLKCGQHFDNRSDDALREELPPEWTIASINLEQECDSAVKEWDGGRIAIRKKLDMPDEQRSQGHCPTGPFAKLL